MKNHSEGSAALKAEIHVLWRKTEFTGSYFNWIMTCVTCLGLLTWRQLDKSMKMHHWDVINRRVWGPWCLAEKTDDQLTCLCSHYQDCIVFAEMVPVKSESQTYTGCNSTDSFCRTVLTRHGYLNRCAFNMQWMEMLPPPLQRAYLWDLCHSVTQDKSGREENRNSSRYALLRKV